MRWDKSKGQEKKCKKKSMKEIKKENIEYVQSNKWYWEEAKKNYERRMKD